METETKRFRSLLKRYFPVELCVQLDAITTNHSFVNNNYKSKAVAMLLDQYKVPWTALGNGTNRYGIKIEQYAVKIALDRAGRIDNLRELKYSKMLYPAVVKVYECTVGSNVLDSGLLAVSEYVEPFSQDDLHRYDANMRKILSNIGQYYLVGDVGISTDNYANWGIRDDGTICILDFAYIYSLTYRGFMCTCDDEGTLEYDRDFNYLVCPYCKRKWAFRDIRKRISREDEEREIGDIKSLGYVVHNKEEDLPIDPEKSPAAKPKKEKKPEKKVVEKQTKIDLTLEEQEERLRKLNEMLYQ